MTLAADVPGLPLHAGCPSAATAIAARGGVNPDAYCIFCLDKPRQKWGLWGCGFEVDVAVCMLYNIDDFDAVSGHAR